MPRRILFTSQKGGVGKSALARSLAVALAERGRRVLLADFDADQGSCLRWRAQRDARDLKPAIPTEGFSKPEKLNRIRKNRQDIVIDTPGRLDELSISLARIADAVLLPSSFSLDDIMPTLRMVETLRRARASDDGIAIVFCRTGGSARQETQARSILAMNGVRALDPVLAQKDGYAPLFATGRTGREAPNPHLRAAALAVDAAMAAFVDDAHPADRQAEKGEERGLKKAG